MRPVGGGSTSGADGATNDLAPTTAARHATKRKQHGTAAQHGAAARQLAPEQRTELLATLVDVLTQDRFDDTNEEATVIRQVHCKLASL